nr:ORF3 [Afoambidensovirus incertum 1]
MFRNIIQQLSSRTNNQSTNTNQNNNQIKLLGNRQHTNYIVEKLSTITKKDKILHDIIIADSNEHSDNICKSLTRESTRKNDGIVIHYGHNRNGWWHVHVIHDCSYLNSSCRCAFLNSFTIRRRHNQNIRNSREITDSYWRNLLLYFLQKQEGTINIKVGTENIQTIPTENEYLSDPNNQESIEKRLVEIFSEGYHDLCEHGSTQSKQHTDRHSSNEPIAQPLTRPSTSNYGKQNNRRPRGAYDVSRVILSNLCSPLKLIKNTEDWLNNPYLTQIKQETWEKAENIAKRTINRMDIETLFKFIHNKLDNFPIDKLYLGAVHQPYETYYMSLEETDIFIEELLKSQFDENDENIACFVHTLFKILDRTNGKKNCLEIIGPPSSCKSLFVTYATEAFLNVGYCSKCNKYERFGFQDITNCRVGILDDANFDPFAKQVMLTILSGNKTNVSIKNQGDEIMLKTPIININNKSIFNGREFDERIVRYRWKEYRVDIEKLPNPCHVFYLFNKYNCFEM